MPFKNLSQKVLLNIAGEMVYKRGMEYFRSGNVKKIWLEDTTLYATVVGSYGDYRVTISDNNKNFDYSCTCPYEEGCCKHVVATALVFLDQKENILKKADKIADNQYSFKERVLQLEKEEVVNLLMLSLKTHKDWKSTLLKEISKSLEKKGSKDIDKIYKEQFSEYLDRISSIIDERNEYGGGPDEDYDEINEMLDEISQLIKKKKINTEMRRRFIDMMIHYYKTDNAGVGDMVQEAAYSAAETDEDWKFIISKLNQNDEYQKGLIMDIYKDRLHDEATYLAMRQSQLHWGMDYYDLVKFYQEKGDTDKALQIAKAGITKGQGRIIDLLEYLFEYYKSKDYPEALIYAKKIFQEEKGLQRYDWLKEFVKPVDWTEIDLWCRKQLGKDDLAVVHLENKEYAKVLVYVLEKPSNYNMFTYGFNDKDKLAEKLIPIYPQEMLGFYKEKVDKYVQQMGRENYQKAAEYAQFVKKIYQDYLHQNSEWEAYISTIRSSNPKRPALLDEFKRL